MGNIKLIIKNCSLTVLIMASDTALAAGSASSNYALPWDVLDGGGGMSNSSSYALLSGSVAQGTVGQSSSAGYVMLSGFHSLPDSDSDAIKNFMDNCTEVNNTSQRDTNGDGYGNICDPDLDDSGAVNFADLNIMKSRFFTADADADLNGDGAVNFGDLTILKSMFFQPPGPSGVAP